MNMNKISITQLSTDDEQLLRWVKPNGNVISILAMPTTGKSTLKDKLTKEGKYEVVDTDDFYDMSYKKTLDKDKETLYLQGAFLSCLAKAHELSHDTGKTVLLLTNLWYRGMTRLFKFDLSVSLDANLIVSRSAERGGSPIAKDKAEDWVKSASPVYPKISKHHVHITSDQNMSLSDILGYGKETQETEE